MKNKNLLRALSASVILVLVGIDQLIKLLVDTYLKPIGSYLVIPKVLQLNYHENDGAMMGMLNGKIEIMTVLSVVCIIAIVVVIFSGKLKFGVEYCCIVFMAAGGLGNIIDRVFRGYVIDYIEVLFVDFYIFNFADCFITCATVVMLIFTVYQMFKESKEKKEKSLDG